MALPDFWPVCDVQEHQANAYLMRLFCRRLVSFATQQMICLVLGAVFFCCFLFQTPFAAYRRAHQ